MRPPPCELVAKALANGTPGVRCQTLGRDLRFSFTLPLLSNYVLASIHANAAPRIPCLGLVVEERMARLA